VLGKYLGNDLGKADFDKYWKALGKAEGLGFSEVYGISL